MERKKNKKKQLFVLVIGLLLSGCIGVVQVPDNEICNRLELAEFLEKLDSTLDKLDNLGLEFGDSQNPDEAQAIADETYDLRAVTFNLERPECAEDAHISLLQVILHFNLAQKAILNNDLDTFDEEYSKYEFAFNQLVIEEEELKGYIR